MLNSASKNQNDEEFQKNCIKDFLHDSFGYSCNTRGKVDLAIYDDEIPKVLFEVKSLGNKAEFVKSPKDLSSKALYESILYYLREWHKHKNNNIKHIILCTAKEFYILKATDYHRLFAKNKDIERAYNNCDFNEGNDTSTARFYKQVESIIEAMGDELEFCYINVESTLNNQNALALLYTLLSPNFLLQIPRYIDANTLNERFYKELLYILGLVQVEQNGKALILPSTTPNTLLHSIKRDFADKLPQDSGDSNALDSGQNISDSPKSTQNQAQDSHDSSDIFDSHIFPLIMLWNNRILFLRLLESMLLSFRHITKPFLDISILGDFGALNTLFFKVLAVKNRTDIPPNLADIPYLNSSLFEKSALESQGFEIASLESRPLQISPDSILRRDKDLRQRYKDECLPLLEYLFAFLHAYDFTTTPSDIANNAKTNHDKLINSAVLGLVFEKLNGYKEGSFYTPSFITSYMCENSLRKIVLEKFQESGFKAQSLTALRNEIDINKLNEANKIFLSIRICDPAVGSGHFLVSALNELIALKSELGLLLDCDGVRLSDIDLVLENDELLIKDSKAQMLDYTIPAHERVESHKIQKAIFYTKKELIENCLFGVDINPNSVEICKLRLWIELLKYSYYENIASKELQTLPNIDINIKCGNSLISYFDLHQSLSHYPNIATKIKQYQQAVRDYKEGIFANRNQINATIKELLQSFRNFCFSDKFKKEIKSFHTNCESYSKKYGNFLAKDDENLRLYVAQSFGYFDFDEDKARADFALLKKEYESIFSLESNKPFEWRFEFPEVLDKNGEFMGFDLIIGNPPYIRQEEIKELKPHLQKSFYIYSGTSDIYTYFYERGHSLLKPNGILTLITSNKFCRAGYGANLRAFLLQSAILDFVDLNGVKVFDKATVDTCIVNLSKQKPTKSHTLNYANPNAKDLSTLAYSQIPQDSLSSEAFIFVDSPTLALKQKIEQIGTPLKQWDIEINYGIKTGYNEAFIIDTATKDRILDSCESVAEKERTAQIIKPILRGRDIKRYSYEWANLWLINTHNGYSLPNGEKIPRIDIDNYPALKKHLDKFYPQLQKRTDKGATPYNLRNCAYVEDFEKEKIVYQTLARTGNAFNYDNAGFFVPNSAYILVGENLKYLVGLLNSKIMLWYLDINFAKLDETGWSWIKDSVEKLPIPKITAKNQNIADKIVNLVDKILQAKARYSSADTSDLESQIDNLTYELYNLSPKEIQIIQGY